MEDAAIAAITARLNRFVSRAENGVFTQMEDENNNDDEVLDEEALMAQAIVMSLSSEMMD